MSIWNIYFDEIELSLWALEFCVFNRDCITVRQYIVDNQHLKLYYENDYESLKDYLEILRMI